MAFFISLLVGGIAGWVAALIAKEHGYGLIADVAIGAIGGLIGGWVFVAIGLSGGGFFASLITAIIGAVIFIGAFQAAKRGGMFAS